LVTTAKYGRKGKGRGGEGVQVNLTPTGKRRETKGTIVKKKRKGSTRQSKNRVTSPGGGKKTQTKRGGRSGKKKKKEKVHRTEEQGRGRTREREGPLWMGGKGGQTAHRRLLFQNGPQGRGGKKTWKGRGTETVRREKGGRGHKGGD